MKRTLFGAVVALALVAGAAQAAIQVGQTGPNFTKPKLTGGSASLSDYSGKVVVLFLFGYA